MIEKQIAAEDGTVFVAIAFTFSDGKNPVTLAEALQNPTRYIVMQSTGLRDCSGKEIFEGDIVLVDDEFRDGVRDKVIVEWVDSREFVGWNVARDDGGEVIGNIYENPDLLPDPSPPTRIDGCV
jgi:hypothetical protein